MSLSEGGQPPVSRGKTRPETPTGMHKARSAGAPIHYTAPCKESLFPRAEGRGMESSPQTEFAWMVHSVKIQGIFFQGWCHKIIEARQKLKSFAGLATGKDSTICGGLHKLLLESSLDGPSSDAR